MTVRVLQTLPRITAVDHNQPKSKRAEHASRAVKPHGRGLSMLQHTRDTKKR